MPARRERSSTRPTARASTPGSASGRSAWSRAANERPRPTEVRAYGRQVTFRPYSVVARNIDPTSDNRIHADDVAQQFGFSGALVPGVELFAYVTAPLFSAWGPSWLAGGRVDIRFRRPVY